MIFVILDMIFYIFSAVNFHQQASHAQIVIFVIFIILVVISVILKVIRLISSAEIHHQRANYAQIVILLFCDYGGDFCD